MRLFLVLVALLGLGTTTPAQAGYDQEFGPILLGVRSDDGMIFPDFQFDLAAYHKVWGTYWRGNSPRIGWHSETLDTGVVQPETGQGYARVEKRYESSSVRAKDPVLYLEYSNLLTAFRTNDGTILWCMTLERANLAHYMEKLGYGEVAGLENCNYDSSTATDSGLTCRFTLPMHQLKPLIDDEVRQCKEQAEAIFEETRKYPKDPILP